MFWDTILSAFNCPFYPDFFEECCRNANGLWYVWVYLMGTKTEAKDYTYEIKISSDDQVKNTRF